MGNQREKRRRISRVCMKAMEKSCRTGISKRGRTAMGIIFCSWNQWRSPESRLQLQRASKAENFLDACLTDATGTEVRRLQ